MENYGKIKDNIKSNNSNSYDAKYMKVRLYSYDDLTLRKPLDLYDVIIVIRCVFFDNNKYYPQVVLSNCL